MQYISADPSAEICFYQRDLDLMKLFHLVQISNKYHIITSEYKSPKKLFFYQQLSVMVAMNLEWGNFMRESEDML